MQVGAPRRTQGRQGGLDRAARPGGDAGGDGDSLREEVLRRDDPVDQADRLRPLCVDHLAGQRQLGGDPGADQPRQEPGAAVAGRQADRDVGVAEPGRGRGDADVARQREVQAAGGGSAVHGGDERQPGGRHLLDHREDRRRVVGLAGAGQLVLDILAHGRQIGPRGELRSGAGHHHRPHRRVGVQRGQSLGEIGGQLGDDAVAPVRAVQREQDDAVGRALGPQRAAPRLRRARHARCRWSRRPPSGVAGRGGSVPTVMPQPPGRWSLCVCGMR